MKKLIIALILCLLPQMAFGALVTKDDFNRVDSQALSTSTKNWIERFNTGQGEAAITGNRLEITVNATARTRSNQAIWLEDTCMASHGCQIYVTLGLDDLSYGGTNIQHGSGVVIMSPRTSLFSDGGGLFLHKTMTGTIILYEDGIGQITTWTSTNRPKDDTGEDVSITIYMSDSNVMMDACWGAVGNPCSGWSITGYNLTSSGLTITNGYTGVYQFDNQGLGNNIWWFDNFKLNIPEKLVWKPWLSGLSSSGVTVHAISTSTANSLSVQYGTNPALSTYSETTPSPPIPNDGLVEVMSITGLTANTKYYYRIKVSSTVDSNIYSFITLPTAGIATNYRFAVIGCYSINQNSGVQTWANAIVNHNPLFVIATGDNGYFDNAGDRLFYFKEEWLLRRKSVYLQTAMANIPWFAMYNDHDSGSNDNYGARDYIDYGPGVSLTATNGSVTVSCATCDFTTNVPTGGHTSFLLSNSNNTYQVSSWTATTLTLAIPFHEATETTTSWKVRKNMKWANDYYPLYYNNPVPPAGYDSDANYFSFQVGRTKFWVTNPLQYADNPSDTEGPNKEMLGDNQFNWLFDGTANNYKNDTAPLKFLVMGEPLWTERSSGGTMQWNSYLYERAKVLSGLRSVISKTIILSGDSHVLGYNNVNFIPSVMEVGPSRAAPAASVCDLQYKTGWYASSCPRGFVVVDVNDNGTDIVAEIKFYDENNNLLRTVYHGSTTTRVLVCDYDATTCPNGRGAP